MSFSLDGTSFLWTLQIQVQVTVLVIGYENVDFLVKASENFH